MEGTEQENGAITPISPNPPSRSIEVIEHVGPVHMYGLIDAQLDMLLASFSSMHSTLFGITAGGAIAVAITLFTVDLSDRQFGAFVPSLIVLIVLSAFFGWQALRDRGRAEKIIDTIKRR